jgi:hypothetical protein
VRRKKTSPADTGVEPIRQPIEHWRARNARRCPNRFGWRGEHGVYAAAQALRLSYDSLRSRAEAAGAPRRVRRDRCACHQPAGQRSWSGCRNDGDGCSPRSDRGSGGPEWSAATGAVA